MHSNPHSNQPRKPPHPTQHADSRGYYLALHVSPDASQEEISRAFRALIRVRHPDVGHSGGRGAAAEDDVRSILAAFAVLRNPRTRAEYDRTEHAAARLDAAQQGRHNTPMHDFPVRDVPARTIPVHTVPPRDVPVRIIRQRGPLLHVSPVRWERGTG